MIEIAPSTKILVLSADSDVCFKLVILLKQVGLRNVECLSHGSQALDQLVVTPVEVILCHQNLNGLSGWNFVKEFKTGHQLANAAVILFGDAPSPAPASELHQYGVPPFIVGMPTIKSIMEAIASTLGQLRTAGSVEQRYSAAKSALIAGRAEEAVSSFASLREITAKNARSTVGLAEAHFRNHEAEAAERVIEEVVPTKETSIPLLFMQARLALARKDANGGEALLSRLLTESSGSSFYYRVCIQLALDHSLLDFAATCCQKAVTAGIDDQDIELLRAKVLYKQGATEKAYKIVKNFKHQGPNTVEILNFKGVCLRRLGKHTAALQCYSEALQAAPNDEKIYFNLALCMIAIGDVARAEEMLQSALTVAPSFAKAADKLSELRRLRGVPA